MKKIVSIIVAMLVAVAAMAQEFECQIQISHQQLQGTNYEKIFQEMRKDLYEFINNTKWTNNVFSKNERIECNISITVEKEVASDEYSGKIQVTSSRPVYGTSYMSPLFNYLDDKFQFKYVEMEPIEFNPNVFTSNLSAVIAYYCYIMLGLDYDSFGSQAGTQYYQMAEKIVQNAQGAHRVGSSTKAPRTATGLPKICLTTSIRASAILCTLIIVKVWIGLPTNQVMLVLR